MPIASSRLFLPVQNSYVGHEIFVPGFIWLLVALYSVGWFRPVPNGSDRLWPLLSMLFSSSGFI